MCDNCFKTHNYVEKHILIFWSNTTVVFLESGSFLVKFSGHCLQVR